MDAEARGAAPDGAAASSVAAGRSSGFGEAARRAEYFFRRKHAAMLALLAALLVLAAASSIRASFDPVETLMDLPGSFAWFVQSFMPSVEALDKLPKILAALWKTFLGAAAAAATSALLAYVLALVGSTTVGFGGPVQLAVRAVATVTRNIPNVAWAFILIFSFRQSEFTGFLVLFMKSFGFLLRSFMENIDEVSQEAVEALRAVGATRLQIVAHVVVPLTITQVVSWLLYMTETNTRDATLVGMLTGTGIGFVFELYYRTFRYDVAGLVIVCIACMALLCELASNFVRRRVLSADDAPLRSIGLPKPGNGPRAARVKVHVLTRSGLFIGITLAALSLLAVYGFVQMDYGEVDLLDATFGAFNNFGVMVFHPGTDGYWTVPELLNDLVLTISLAVLTTLCGAVVALLVALAAACNLTNKAVSNVLKLLLSVVRAVPTIIWVLVFVISIGLGAEACIVGMMFHTVAFLAKAYSEAFEEIDPGALEALRSTGATWWQTVAHCVLPEKMNELISWTFIRFENNFVNTVVIAAMCGSGGIGYQLYLAANFYFSMHAVGLITYLCLAVSVALELAATCLRKRFAVSR